MVALWRICGSASVIGCFVAIAAAILTALAELSFAWLIEVLLFTLGLLDGSQFNNPLFWLASYGPTGVCISIVCLGAVRATVIALNLTIPSIMECLALARLRQSALAEELTSGRAKSSASEELILRLSSVFPQASRWVGVFFQALNSSLIAILLCIFMFAIDATMAAVAIAAMALIGGVAFFVYRRVREISQQQLDGYSILAKAVERISKNWILISVLRTHHREYKDLTFANTGSARAMAIALTLGSASSVMVSFFGVCVLALLVWIHSTYQVPAATAFVALVYMLMRMVQQLTAVSNYFGQLSALSPFRNRALELLSNMSSEVLIHSRKHSSIITTNISQVFEQDCPSSQISCKNFVEDLPVPAIKVWNLSFSFVGRDNPVLQNVDLDVKPSTLTCLIGASGAGKSTLLELILGLHRPSSGYVHIDGVSAVEYCEKNYSRIAYVGADPMMLNGTIKQNLDYGKVLEYTDDDYWNALKLAHIDSFVRDLPGNLECKVFGGARKMSAGEMQRLALARAMLRHPMLLVLDEFTANLDHVHETQLIETLSTLKAHCTIVLTSHRKAVFPYCDLILEIQSPSFGRVA